jgi:PAS domain S-box-containing protein
VAGVGWRYIDAFPRRGWVLVSDEGLASRVPVPVLTVSRDGVVLRANDAASEYFDANATQGASIVDAVLDPGAEAMQALLSCDEETRRRVPFSPDDQTRRPDVVATPVADGVELVVDTVAERDRYARLVESVGDPMYVLDVNGYVETVNDALIEAYGHGRDDLLGSHATEFMPESAFERGTEKIKGLLSGDRTTATLEFAAQRGDGTEAWAEVNLGVLTDDDGSYAGAVGVIRDVSERKRRAKELADFETIAETAPVAMFTVDEDGVLTWANWRMYERAGTTQDELVGRPFPELVEAGFVEWEMIERYQEYLRDLLSSETDVERVEHEEVLYPPGADPMHVEAYTALLPLDEDGQFTGTVNAFRDITRRKTYREELERQNERLEAFASAVSHDLRNPLNVANGHLNIARDRYPDDDALAEVATSHSRMSELIDDVLSLARQGESVTETEPFDLELAARRAWETVSTGSSSLTVRTTVTVVADESRTRQLFENTFRNSVEHGSTGSRPRADDSVGHGSTGRGAESDAVDEHRAGVDVTVGVLADGDGFYVADDGPGLPDDVNVFESGATTDDNGTGLGLAIVSEVVDAHGWTVEATASAAGGARFEVTGVEFVDSDDADGDTDTTEDSNETGSGDGDASA